MEIFPLLIPLSFPFALFRSLPISVCSLLQKAWAIINDSYLTTVCLKHAPYMIALGENLLSYRRHRFHLLQSLLFFVFFPSSLPLLSLFSPSSRFPFPFFSPLLPLSFCLSFSLYLYVHTSPGIKGRHILYAPIDAKKHPTNADVPHILIHFLASMQIAAAMQNVDLTQWLSELKFSITEVA